MTLAVCFDAAGQSLEEARAARERARADLIKAQEAFDRADEAYIRALGGAAGGTVVPQPAASIPAASINGTRRASVVTFSMSGVGALDANLFDYRARLIVDGQPGPWTEHASGAKYPVPSGTRSLAYEVQNNPTGDLHKPAWKTVCEGKLPIRAAAKVDVVIAGKIRCEAR